MASHQKYFPKFSDDNSTINGFYVVSNQENDKELIIKGNERVLHARLNDAKFFYNNDLKKPLAELNQKLKNIAVHKDIGSVFEQVARIEDVINTTIRNSKVFSDTDIDNAIKATKVCKADLASEVVTEFPELQGIMGYYYAKNAGYAGGISHKKSIRLSKSCI